MKVDARGHHKAVPHKKAVAAHALGHAGHGTKSTTLAPWQNDLYDCLRPEAKEHTQEGRVSVILGSLNQKDHDSIEDLCQRFDDTESGRVLPLVNGFTASISARSFKKFIAQLPEGAHMAVDHSINFEERLATSLRFLDAGGPVNVQPGETAVSRLPGLDKVWAQGYTGKGQCVAVIDSGIFPTPDLKDRVVGWVDLADKKEKMVDPFGHGTHVSGILAGNGTKSSGGIKGVAPEANLVGVRIGSIGDAITAIQWVIDNKDKYNISVVNLSLGDVASKPWKNDPWALACQKAIDAGLTLVAAAGNDGPKIKTISTPGILPDVITVGAIDDRGTLNPSDDLVAPFSSRGPTPDGLTKPDVMAPGVRIFGTLSPGSSMDVSDLPHVRKDYVAMSGTSQATPMVAGLALILKQANDKLTPQDIRQIMIQSSLNPFKDDANTRGAGEVQADKALELALTWKPGSVPSASHVA